MEPPECNVAADREGGRRGGGSLMEAEAEIEAGLRMNWHSFCECDGEFCTQAQLICVKEDISANIYSARV